MLTDNSQAKFAANFPFAILDNSISLADNAKRNNYNFKMRIRKYLIFLIVKIHDFQRVGLFRSIFAAMLPPGGSS